MEEIHKRPGVMGAGDLPPLTQKGALLTEIGPGSPASLDRGGMARSFHVAIAIASMNRSTEAIADPLHSVLFRADVK